MVVYKSYVVSSSMFGDSIGSLQREILIGWLLTSSLYVLLIYICLDLKGRQSRLSLKADPLLKARAPCRPI